jgi:hypothetical protein
MNQELLKVEQGFFVKNVDNTYSGLYLTLNEARSDARSKGPDLEIYHGVLKHTTNGEIDNSELFLIPKVKND